MSVLILAFLLGWFSLTVPVSAETEKDASKTVSAEAKKKTEESFEFPGSTDEDWRKRLLAVKQSDRWSVGAEIGMDLVRIPGDRPYEILSANWKKIASSARKQILKGFTPGMMGNKGIHARFFDVMHLGMMDSNPGVRSYAATYIEMQGLPNFEHDAKGYMRWREEFKGISAKKIAEKSNAKPEVPQTQQAQGSADKQWQTRLLALKEGGNWLEGAKVGRELLQLPGDRPYKILKANWPKIATSARKQILKGFTPGMMGNKEMHPAFFDVMDLGMSDKDAGIRSFAANYLKMQGLQDFEYDLSLYKLWRKGIKGLPAKEVMKQIKAPKRTAPGRSK